MKYFIRNVQDEEFGPFSSGELRVLVRQNRLGDGDFVRREVGTTWHAFHTIPGLGCDAPSRDDGRPHDVPSTMAATVEGWDTDHLPDVDTDDEPPALLEVTHGEARPEPVEPVAASAQTTRRTKPVHPVRRSETSEARVSLESLAEMPDPIPTPRPAPSAAMTPPPSDGEAPEPVAIRGQDEDPDEETRYVRLQEDALDAFRRSWVSAILGRRACLHILGDRVDLVTPGVLRSQIQACWLDAVDAAAVRTRRSLLRIVVGAMLVIGSVGSAVSLLLGFGDQFASPNPVPVIVGSALMFLVGLAILLLSTSRVLEVHAGSQTLRLNRSRIDPTVVDWIGTARSRHNGDQISNSSSVSSSTRS